MNASDLTTMYHVNPVVSDLNKVPGFDPLKYVRETKDGLKLDLPYKKLWFRLKHPNGIVRPLLIKMTDQLAIIEARVFFDRRDSEPAASFIAQCSKDEIGRGDYIKAAQNSAIDQALSDAGFGVQFVPAEPKSTDKAEVASVKSAEHSEASVSQKVQTVSKSQPVAETKVVNASPSASETKPPIEKAVEVSQPIQTAVSETVKHKETACAAEVSQTAPASVMFDDGFEEIIIEEPKAETVSAPTYTEDMPVEQILALMSQEEAENYVVKEGTCAGWTLAQVADRRPFSLKFYIQGYQGKDNILRAAATIMVRKTAA